MFHGERVRGKYVLLRDGRQELDDPPHGPARGSDARADPREGRADARHRRRAATGRRLGVRDQVGRRARHRLRRRRPRPDVVAQQHEHHAPLPRAGLAGPRAECRTRRSSTARSSFDGGVPSFQRLQRRMHLTSEGAVRRLSQSEAGRLHHLRPAVARRALAAGTALQRPPLKLLAKLELTGSGLAGPGAPCRRRRGRARRLTRRASRASSPSASTSP